MLRSAASHEHHLPGRRYSETVTFCKTPVARGTTARITRPLGDQDHLEHGEVTSFEVIARYVEALGGRLDLVADFGDRTVRLPVSKTAA
jgi:hypothetical protein